MTRVLRQSNLQTVVIGPFIDDSDFITPSSALIITPASILISKNAAGFAAKNEANNAGAMGNGFYDCRLDTDDTASAGRLVVAVNFAGQLPVWHEFNVVPQNTYQGFWASGDTLEVHMTEITAGLLTSFAFASNAFTSDKFATDAIDADALKADAVTKIVGTPVALDGGTASIAGMLSKMADDNGGGDFNAQYDSLSKAARFLASAITWSVVGFIATGTLKDPDGTTIATITVNESTGDRTITWA